MGCAQAQININFEPDTISSLQIILVASGVRYLSSLDVRRAYDPHGSQLHQKMRRRISPLTWLEAAPASVAGQPDLRPQQPRRKPSLPALLSRLSASIGCDQGHGRASGRLRGGDPHRKQHLGRRSPPHHRTDEPDSYNLLLFQAALALDPSRPERVVNDNATACYLIDTAQSRPGDLILMAEASLAGLRPLVRPSAQFRAPAG